MSDLRKALEELAAERDSVSGHTASDYSIQPYELRELLAAHPEPAPRPVVDREAAIEAVSARLHIGADQIFTGGSPRQLVADTTAVHEAVDAVLELSRPMPTLAQIATALTACGAQKQIDEWPEQYRIRQAAAVLALINGQ